uniref:Ribosomal protein S3 n=1 Tax=Nitzschia putrida TaxID=2742595 RepID=A0A7R7TQY2_9STRA|nr:ribosomal protein S3 [Nitzschia putrida]
MGQKINPTIFRLGVNKTWKTEFFEKKTHELPLYTFKDLEIKNYVERFFETQGILLHDYKQHYSNSTLNLYISYFISSEFSIDKKSKNANNNYLTLINSEGVKKTVLDTFSSDLKTYSIFKNSLFKNQNAKEAYKMKNYLKSNSNTLLESNLAKLNTESNKDLLTSMKIEGILNNFFRVLSLFTNNKFNIVVNFCCLNKDLSYLKKTQEKNFMLLQKFKSTPSFKEGIELLFHTVYSKSSAYLLTKFIALQIKKVKRHKFFLAFLKQALTVLLNSKFSKVKGVKIIIKGRLNGVPRASHKILTIGDTPVQSLNAVIDYAQMTVHNANGSYGIKVWVVEK